MLGGVEFRLLHTARSIRCAPAIALGARHRRWNDGVRVYILGLLIV